MVIVRWVTDRQAVTSAQADNWIANTHWQNQNALRFGCFGFTDAFSAPLFSACSARRKRYSLRKSGGQLPTLIVSALTTFGDSGGII
ncbi:MAG: hypothetical protein LBQ66_08685 [Planctomycetaceae bacterium]|nr:hypothetical protein [Planctomycetaceae bacterium]